ncbi:RcnB family protein [Luteimonas sp. RD2P54]|uniref:RcnB family protein n=1 Tax=Luteimonas endophytica TaxID=3042023 RepID=A0ABT6J7Q4_9GAMM|nr:RcnB family protein [Luteimonas endophytica]MDH5822850.1 RcnB family protein [Luteimonas endophytica]
MNHHILAASLAALALASSPALADRDKSRDRGGHGGPPVHAQAHGDNPPKAHGRHDNGRHLGWQKQAWRRGERFPLEHLEPAHYIDDYHAYRLDSPPRGHRWVRPDADRYLLVETATGLIVEALGD